MIRKQSFQRLIRPSAVVLLVGMVLALSATTLDTFSQNSGITGKYLLAFNTCDRNMSRFNCEDPLEFQIQFAQSNNGTQWEAIPGFRAFEGDTPDIIRRGNVLYVYYQEMRPPAPQPKVRKFHLDTNTWDPPVSLKINGARAPHFNLAAGKEIFVEPSAILDEQNRIVLFYRLFYRAGFEIRAGDTEYIRSATEVEGSGSDGTEFTVDPGERFKVQIRLERPDSPNHIGNPEVIKGKNGFVLYVSFNNPLNPPGLENGFWALQSRDLKGSYTQVSGLQNGILGFGSQMTGDFDSSSGQYWTYDVGDFLGHPRNSTIVRAVHERVDKLISNNQWTTVIRNSSFSSLGSSVLLSEPSFLPLE